MLYSDGNCWMGHTLRHDGLLHEITEGRMKGMPTTGRRLQMPHNLTAEKREGWRYSGMIIIIIFV